MEGVSEKLNYSGWILYVSFLDIRNYFPRSVKLKEIYELEERGSSNNEGFNNEF